MRRLYISADSEPALQSACNELPRFCNSLAYFDRMIFNRVPKGEVKAGANAGAVDLFVELRARGVAVPFALMVSRMSLLSTRRAMRVGIETVWRKPILDRLPLISFLAMQ